MKSFFKYTLAAVLGYFIAAFIVIIVSMVFIFSAISSAEDSFKGKKDSKIKENTILKLSLNSPIVDRASKNPFDELNFNGSFETTKKLGIRDAIKAIENAKQDVRIKGIYMDLSGVNMNMANMEEFRKVLVDFKTSGKFIYAYSEFYDQQSYYMAAVADSIFLNPYGDLDFKGLRTELAFLKNMLEKIEVDMQVIRGSNNKFKSAVEPFLYEKMSDANREQLSILINTYWNYLLDGIADSRNLSKDELNNIADNLLAANPYEALNLKLIDATLYEDEVTAFLKQKAGIDEDDDLEFAGLSKMAKTNPKLASSEEDTEEEKPEKPWEKKKEKIAIIYAGGEIRSGNSEPDVMGSATIAKAIKDAREDSTIKAIVLRVNSPGGSALASEVIWRETQLAKEAKPFIVSMGGVAASGGYYISCGADKIFADATTVTGSIGVFGVIPNMKEMFNNKLGINFDGVKTNENADIMSVTQPLTDYQYKVIQKSVDRVYATFKQRVADGRGLTVEYVDSIGQGRVWTGINALDLGLVDELGSLETALAYAAEVAGIADEPSYKEFPKEEDPFEKFLKEFSANAKMWFIEQELGEEVRLYKEAMRFKEMKGIQARMPYIIEVN